MIITAESHDKKFNAMLHMFDAARRDSERTAIVKFSAHLDGVIRHVVVHELSAVEIIELLQVESQKLHDAGLGLGA